MSYMVEATVALILVSMAAALRAKPPNPQIPEDADAVFVNFVTCGEIVYAAQKVFGVDVR